MKFRKCGNCKKFLPEHKVADHGYCAAICGVVVREHDSRGYCVHYEETADADA